MKALCIAILGLLLALPAAAAPINATLGKPVTITGEVGVITCCWDPAPVADLGTIVDGILLANGTQWQTGTVWWDERHPESVDNVVEIDLLGSYLISHLHIQFDNNDFYAIRYRDAGGVWLPIATAEPLGDAGMRQRAGAFAPFLATGFQIDAFGGDGFYALSEFQATGSPVPEPGTLLLLGTGISAAIARRRTRRANA